MPEDARDSRPAYSLRPPLYAGSSIRARKGGPSNNDLVDLAAMLEPDGGLPGKNLDVRVGRTIAALLAFVAAGHTLTEGAFRLHVTRLAGFLKSLSATSGSESHLIKTAVLAASTGVIPPGQWLVLARDPRTRWQKIEDALM